MRSANVYLGQLRVGELWEDERGYIEFRVDQEYARMSRRPVLGQWFEDHPRGLQRGDRPGDLPAFFANLIPEGDLGLLLRERLDIDPADDLGLLVAVGSDLPGAVIVQGATEDGESRPQRAARAEHAIGLRFSLAGVQLKFSMIRDRERLVFPGVDGTGDWIAKIAYESFDTLCENELSTMEWARRSGFDVPDCELRRLADLVDVPYQADPDTKVFIIRRFDREGKRRIHQEDFQQILGRRPQKKYDDLTYEQLTVLTMNIVGPGAYEEMIRRLVFVVASGNDDAHAKNWSVVYHDGIHAKLSPLYDQVFTAQWRDFRHELALNLGGAKAFVAIEMARFRELARRTGRDPVEAEHLVAQTLETISTAWETMADYEAVTSDYRAELENHWKRVPLLRPFASRFSRRLL